MSNFESQSDPMSSVTTTTPKYSGWNVPLPEEVPLWRFACYISEILLNIVANILALMVLCRIRGRVIHWNMIIVLKSVYIMVPFVCFPRIIMALDYILPGKLISTDVYVWCLYTHTVSIYFVSILQIALFFERMTATLFYTTYEHNNYYFLICVIVLSVWLGNIAYVISVTINIVTPLVNCILLTLIDLIVAIGYAILFCINLKRKRNRLNASLSSRYQTLENLRSFRPLIALIALLLIYSISVNCLYLVMVTYVLPSHSADRHAAVDAVFNLWTAAVYLCFSLPFAMRSQKALPMVHHRQTVQAETDVYFRQLSKNWMHI
uniref:G_PROTEIN_RECEP_F1_2 domain-containing protein n=1 Tax=Panagrellus redivivus TaxID=6233 RepID=A0A7E4V1I2_PANRE